MTDVTPEQLRNRYKHYVKVRDENRAAIDSIRVDIYRLRRNGTAPSAIAKALGISRSTVYGFSNDGKHIEREATESVTSRSSLDSLGDM